MNTAMPGETAHPRPASLGAYILWPAVATSAVAVWLLRQPWAKQVIWPWFLLLAAMFVAAFGLRLVAATPPGSLIVPRLEPVPSAQRRQWGLVAMVLALLISLRIVVYLWPDYRGLWQGTPAFWLLAMALTVAGAYLIGAVGEGAPRAATARTFWPDTIRNRWLEGLGFLVILALAIFLRTYRIDSVPPGIYQDETQGAMDAVGILAGHLVSPYAIGWGWHANGFYYYMALLFRVFGANFWSLKLASLILGILTVIAVYFLARILFGSATGLAAMALMAVSRWHFSFSRWAWIELAPPLFQLLAFYFLIRALRDRRAIDYAISGLLAGLGIYTYFSSRLAAATIGLFLLYWILSDRRGLRQAIPRIWQGITILVIAAAVSIAPLLVTYLTDPATFSERLAEVSVFNDISAQHSLQPLMVNVTRNLEFFHQNGGGNARLNLPQEPMLDPFTGLLFAIGVAYAVITWRDQRSILLLMWLIIGLSGSFLSLQGENPTAYRSLTALPAVAILAADTLVKLGRTISDELRFRLPGRAWIKLVPWGAGSVIALTLLGAGAWDAAVYFGPQASSMEVMRAFNPTETGIGYDTMRGLNAGKDVFVSAWLAPFATVRFLALGAGPVSQSNQMDTPPYAAIVPETNLPLPYEGHDALLLLERQYWSVRGYFTSYYPHAGLELVTLPDDSPLYVRVQIPQADIQALQGVTQKITYTDGRVDEHGVAQVELADPTGVSRVEWSGSILVPKSDTYDFSGDGGLQVQIDGQPWLGPKYLGRGIYRLNVTRPEGASGGARLTWSNGEGDAVPVPSQVLYNVVGPRNGLLATYWSNENWQGEPLFRQVIPFLLLLWPPGQEVAPTSQFSARYTGALRIDQAGTYTLRIEADDGARLILDGKTIAEAIVPGRGNDLETSIELGAGDHPIEIDYFQNGGSAALKFYWRHGDEPLSAVPPEALIPAQP